MHKVFLVIHIAAVAAWLGGNFAQFATQNRMMAKGGTAAAAWMENVVNWGRILYTPAAIVILATGIGMVLDLPYDFSDTFVELGVLVVIIGAVLGMTVFARGGEKAAAAFASGDDAGGRAAAARLIPWGIFDTVLLLFAVTAMVYHWGASG